jgi:hypothetical protein
MFVLGLSLVPGLIILFICSYFLTGRPLQLKEQAFTYLIITMVYWGLWIVVLGDNLVGLLDTDRPRLIALLGLALVIIAPALVGLLLGVEVKQGWFLGLLKKFKMYPVHPVPNAWDRKFGNMNEEFVVVTTADGTEYCGLLDGHSFASSDPQERDLYIGQLYKVGEGENDPWVPTGNRSILLKSETIVSIEFIKP